MTQKDHPNPALNPQGQGEGGGNPRLPLPDPAAVEWYFTRVGTKVGPVSWAVLKAHADDGSLSPALDLVWNRNLANWAPAGEINGLFKPNAALSPFAANRSPRPAVPPGGQRAAGSLPRADWITWPGFDRSTCILCMILLGVATYLLYLAGKSHLLAALLAWKGLPLLRDVLQSLGDDPGIQRFMQVAAKILAVVMIFRSRRNWDDRQPHEATDSLVYGIVGIIVLRIFLPEPAWPLWVFGVLALLICVRITRQRLQNLGMSRWWALALSVPFLNFWLLYRLFACPAGYAMSRKQDGMGIAVGSLYWLLVALGCAVAASHILQRFQDDVTLFSNPVTEVWSGF